MVNDIFFTIVFFIFLLILIFMCFELSNAFRERKLRSQINTLDLDYLEIMKQEMSEETMTISSLLSAACLYRIQCLDKKDKIEYLIMTKAWKDVRLKLISEVIKEVNTSAPDKHIEIYEAAHKIVSLIQTGELTPKKH